MLIVRIVERILNYNIIILYKCIHIYMQPCVHMCILLPFALFSVYNKQYNNFVYYHNNNNNNNCKN